jgi:hypothetical protein
MFISSDQLPKIFPKYHSDSTHKLVKVEIKMMLWFPIDNIYEVIGGLVSQHLLEFSWVQIVHLC